MNEPRIVQEITLSDLLRQAKRKIVELCLVEELMEMTERDLANIIVRSHTQRQLIRIHAAELEAVIDLLQTFADSNPSVH